MFTLNDFDMKEVEEFVSKYKELDVEYRDKSKEGCSNCNSACIGDCVNGCYASCQGSGEHYW